MVAGHSLSTDDFFAVPFIPAGQRIDGQVYSHGWLGNPTDERRDFEPVPALPFLSVGLPASNLTGHPWDYFRLNDVVTPLFRFIRVIRSA